MSLKEKNEFKSSEGLKTRKKKKKFKLHKRGKGEIPKKKKN